MFPHSMFTVRLFPSVMFPPAFVNSVFSGCQIASMRKTVGLIFTHTCIRLTHNVGSGNARGRNTEIWVAGEPFRGRLTQLEKPREVLVADAVTSIVGYQLTAPFGTYFEPAERLRINGVDYEVSGSFQNEMLVTAWLKRIF